VEQQQGQRQSIHDIPSMLTISNYYSIAPQSKNTVCIPTVTIEENCAPLDLTVNPSFLSLSPPTSIVSSKSPIPIQQQLSSSQSIVDDQKFNGVQSTINDLSISDSSINLHPPLTSICPPYQHYYTIPAKRSFVNIPPPTYPLILPITSSSSSIEEKKKKVSRKFKDTLDSTTVTTSNTSRTTRTKKRQQRRKVNANNERTKILLQRLKRQNRLAVLKFMVRKQRQQQRASKKKKRQPLR